MGVGGTRGGGEEGGRTAARGVGEEGREKPRPEPPTPEI